MGKSQQRARAKDAPGAMTAVKPISVSYLHRERSTWVVSNDYFKTQQEVIDLLAKRGYEPLGARNLMLDLVHALMNEDD